METHNLIRFKTTKQLGEWYDQKYEEMGGCWHTPREDCLKHIEFIGLPHHPAKKLLDVGFGSGDFLSVAQEFVPVRGMDLSEKAIAYATQKYPALKHYILVGDIENVEHLKSIFDYITSIGSIEHCVDIDKALTNCYQLLKDDGFIYIFAPNELWQHFDQPHEQTHTDEEWIEIFEKAGFMVIKQARWGDSSICSAIINSAELSSKVS